MHVRSYMYAVSKTEAPVTKDKRNAGSEEINKQSNPKICGMGQPVTLKNGMGQPVTLKNGRIQNARRGIQMAFEGNSRGIQMKKGEFRKKEPRKVWECLQKPMTGAPPSSPFIILIS